MPATRSNRYQEGSIDRIHRAKGPDVWVYRWRELQDDGIRLQRKKTIGDVKRFPTKSDVQREVENLRAEINAREKRIGKMTIMELWGDFQAKELRSPHADRSPTTIECYLENFKLYLLPAWAIITWIRSRRSAWRSGSLPCPIRLRRRSSGTNCPAFTLMQSDTSTGRKRIPSKQSGKPEDQGSRKGVPIPQDLADALIATAEVQLTWIAGYRYQDRLEARMAAYKNDRLPRDGLSRIRVS